VLDPLDGVDDCGVFRFTGSGTAPALHFLNAERVTLSDGQASYSLDEFRSSSDDYYSYVLDLAPLGVAPQYGVPYSFSASGGALGQAIELGGVRLPDPLSITELVAQSRFERGDLPLTWTGHGQAPLRLHLSIAPRLADIATNYEIECRMADDGAFTIPAAVLQAAPDGFVTATFTREARQLLSTSGKRKFSTIAQVITNHRFALGAACDAANVMAACRSTASSVQAAYEACGLEPPTTETFCPSYLAESCLGCTAYFDCVAAATRCEGGSLTGSSACSCP
jgi:hypothetical protein